MNNTTTSQENTSNQTSVPVPADLILRADLSERLGRLSHEPRYLVPSDIIFILSRANGEVDSDFLQSDVTFARECAWLALGYQAQIEEHSNNHH